MMYTNHLICCLPYDYPPDIVCTSPPTYFHQIMAAINDCCLRGQKLHGVDDGLGLWMSKWAESKRGICSPLTVSKQLLLSAMWIFFILGDGICAVQTLTKKGGNLREQQQRVCVGWNKKVIAKVGEESSVMEVGLCKWVG